MGEVGVTVITIFSVVKRSKGDSVCDVLCSVCGTQKPLRKGQMLLLLLLGLLGLWHPTLHPAQGENK